MLIHQMLETTAQKFPDKAAVFCAGRWATYGEIDSKSSQLATFFLETGVKRGDRIALLSEHSIYYIISYFAILKADAVVVALNTELLSKSLYRILNHCNALGVVVSNKFIGRISAILDLVGTIEFIVCENAVSEEEFPGLGSVATTLNSIFEQCSITRPASKSIDIDLSSLIYTSGSTGEPKGVMLSHLNIVQNTRSIVEYLKLTSDDRVMVVLPFYYVYGNSLLNTHVCAGGSLVIDNRFAYPNLILETMKEHQVTGFAGVPSTFMILLNKSILKDFVPFQNLRYVTQAGGHLAVSIQEQVVRAFAPAKLIVMYGATELAPRLTWLPPEMWYAKKGSIGIPIPNTDAFVADSQGNRLLPDCESEIVARGSNVMMGYWRDPESTAKVLRHGLYYTGDIGRMDENGFLYVVGRSKEMLKIGGNRVYVGEIEDAILQLEHIAEVAVIGVEDPILGEAAKAFVVKNANTEIDALMIKQALSLKISHYKIPKYFEFCESLPKNESGKILKQNITRSGNQSG
jgi:long-chain acyl-CoA synthetase